MIRVVLRNSVTDFTEAFDTLNIMVVYFRAGIKEVGMSLDSHRRAVEQLMKNRAALEKDLAQKRSKVAKLRDEIATIRKTITPRTSSSMLRTKENRIKSKQTALSRHDKEVAELEGKLAATVKSLYSAISNLEGTETREQKKKDTAEGQRRNAELQHAKDVTKELENQAHLQRQLGQSHYVIDLKQLPEEITVLFVATNFGGKAYLELDDEMRSIQQRIRASEYREAIRVEPCLATRAPDLLQALNQHKPHIVHFSGHGSENGDLVFRRDDGSPHHVSPGAIAQTFKTAGNDDLCLVIFNACHSQAQAQAVTEHIDLAIGMGDAVSDDAAREFAAQFYAALGFGYSVAQAFGQAKAAVMMESRQEQDTPQLFARDGIDPERIILIRPPADSNQN